MEVDKTVVRAEKPNFKIEHEFLHANFLRGAAKQLSFRHKPEKTGHGFVPLVKRMTVTVYDCDN